MEARYLKIIFVVFVAVLALLYATQNIVNLGVAYQVIASVVGMENHEYYSSSLGPAITSPILIWLTTGIIILLEYAAGLLAAKGAWDLWQARGASGPEFNAAKKYALLGCGTGVIVWFGLFGVIGGAYFQMWQTELGANSLEGAFQYFGACALVLLFLNMKDE